MRWPKASHTPENSLQTIYAMNTIFLKRKRAPAALAALALMLALGTDLHAGEAKSSLHVVTIGVSHYQHNRNLRFAAKDAQDLRGFFQDQEGKLFGQVFCQTLTDAQATRKGILSALKGLKAKVQEDDQVLVYLAGHGARDDFGNYYFCPHDFNHFRPETTWLYWRDLHKALANLPGKCLLILDTCHAGSIDRKSRNTALPVRDTRGHQLVVFAASLASETSLELGSLQNGAFTHALLEGLQGKADRNKEGVITLADVQAYVSRRVAELTDDVQHPDLICPSAQARELALATASVTVAKK
jgi:uncharacterized caspase-like protein